MTGYQPKTEKTCATCLHDDRGAFEEPCYRCSDHSPYEKWEPKPIIPPTGGSSGERPPRTPSASETIAMVDAEWCARLQKAGDEVSRLKRREAELLEANNRYLERARDAEAKLADADAATIAMEAKVVDLEQTIARAHAILDQAPGMESRGTLTGLADAVLRAHEELGGDAGPKRGG